MCIANSFQNIYTDDNGATYTIHNNYKRNNQNLKHHPTSESYENVSQYEQNQAQPPNGRGSPRANSLSALNDFESGDDDYSPRRGLAPGAANNQKKSSSITPR